jgi:hypothetical protein
MLSLNPVTIQVTDDLTRYTAKGRSEYYFFELSSNIDEETKRSFIAILDSLGPPQTITTEDEYRQIKNQITPLFLSGITSFLTKESSSFSATQQQYEPRYLYHFVNFVVMNIEGSEVGGAETYSRKILDFALPLENFRRQQIKSLKLEEAQSKKVEFLENAVNRRKQKLWGGIEIVAGFSLIYAAVLFTSKIVTGSYDPDSFALFSKLMISKPSLEAILGYVFLIIGLSLAGYYGPRNLYRVYQEERAHKEEMQTSISSPG